MGVFESLLHIPFLESGSWELGHGLEAQEFTHHRQNLVGPKWIFNSMLHPQQHIGDAAPLYVPWFFDIGLVRFNDDMICS